MNKYELLFIINNEAADEVKDGIVAKLTQLVTDNGGQVEKTDKWGAKKLAYPINYKTEGYYVLINFECEPALVAEIERQIRINDQIMRHMVVKK